MCNRQKSSLLWQLLTFFAMSMDVLCSWTSKDVQFLPYFFKVKLDVQEHKMSMDVHGHVKKCQKISKVVQGRQSRLLFCLLHMNWNRCIYCIYESTCDYFLLKTITVFKYSAILISFWSLWNKSGLLINIRHRNN